MKNQVLELTIDDLNSKGQGVAHHNGLTIFLDGALVSERVLAKIIERKKNYAVGKVISLKHSSSQRVTPKCRYFNSCGGCQLQHMSSEGQLNYKKEHINNAINRIADVHDYNISSIQASPKAFYYRNKMQLPVKNGLNGPCLGFYKRASHEIVEINECHLHLAHVKPLFSAINRALLDQPISIYNEEAKTGVLRQVFIRSTEHTKESVVCFIVTRYTSSLDLLAKKLAGYFPDIVGVCYQIFKKPTNAVIFSNPICLLGQNFVVEKILGLTIKISVGAFFQVNTLQAQNVYESILQHANFTDKQVVLDAYCGIGVLTCLIARKVKQVIGIECSTSSILDAKENMRVNGCRNIEFMVGLSEKLISTIGVIDCAFLNPPRKGCDVKLLEALAKKEVKRLIYMSCHPASLARDMKLLLKLGYKINQIEGFDMFSQTTHVETVVFFTKCS